MYYLSDVRGSDDRVRKMKSFQMEYNSSEGKLRLEEELGTTEDVEMFTELLDNMIRDEEKSKKNNLKPFQWYQKQMRQG